jgi:2-polyprenyl-6-methoxyphenol hydroxylase-like FAD-dependent oxidoreductase
VYARAVSAPLSSIACLGGGPAGLYLAILAKKADPSRRVIVYERNQADDTFGFGVIFSDQTLDSFTADEESHREILASSVRWEDLDVYLHGERVTSTGHGFSGLGRRRMLAILQARAAALGVELRFGEEPAIDDLQASCDLVVAADGVNSGARERHQASLGPDVELGPNRFVWLGSTQPLSAFTFYFDRNDDGLFRVHAYRYEAERSTFIVECTAATFARAGLVVEDEAATVAYCERLFAHRLAGHRLLTNRSLWRRFPTVRCTRWVSGNLVILGDAAHTAHFSIGSGTKLAIDDAIALARSIEAGGPIDEILARYEAGRRPQVERLQRAAETSRHWFEETERYFDKLDPLSFTYSLLTRSLRIDHENLKLRDPQLVARVDDGFAARAGAPRREPPAPPMHAPLALRGLRLVNRLVVMAPSPAGEAGLVLLREGDPEAWGRAIAELRVGGVARVGLVLVCKDDELDALVRACRQAATAGFDLLEVELGSRAPLESIKAVRDAWPADRPLAVRWPAAELTDATADVARARALHALGVDLIHVAGPENAARGRLAHAIDCERLRLDGGVPTMLSGGTRSTGECDMLLAGGRADLCVLAPAEDA